MGPAATDECRENGVLHTSEEIPKIVAKTITNHDEEEFRPEAEKDWKTRLLISEMRGKWFRERTMVALVPLADSPSEVHDLPQNDVDAARDVLDARP